MKILILDNHVLFREGLVSLLSGQRNMTVVGETSSASEAIEVVTDHNPDVILMDIHLPDEDGLEVIKIMLSKRPEVKIVVLTTSDSDKSLFSAIRCGAVGYLLKNIPMSKLVLSLRALDRGEAALSRRQTRRLINEFQRMGKLHNQNHFDIDVLTPRELEVLSLLSTKATNQEIAETLTISENTVKVHVHNILDKLEFRNRYEAGNFARRQGIEPDLNGSGNRL